MKKKSILIFFILMAGWGISLINAGPEMESIDVSFRRLQERQSRKAYIVNTGKVEIWKDYETHETLLIVPL
jgi:hypothetical protein